ncbi:uncharacterized protein LOC126795821 [Argentina anserina]|uniref:uncharacterized protein LOC126795821 n=1 Tax=Argentina anserina TaxID=57926 RepID=UPI0021765589|nr:uncharacterized protein LOC126795821 [Potentilla anserina]
MKTMKDDNNTKEEEEKKKKKKGFITEEDTATLLQRYSATTILTLLQEVSHCVNSEKIDYDALVANTTTGITNAREYQMLWRHLAYREPLPDKFIDGDRPMDVDSDYEYDVEVDPAVTADASTEAAACVKVLISSRLPSDPSHLNGTTVEAPLTINIPSAPAKGMNITVPVSIQRQTLPATTTAAAEKAEGDDANTPASNIMPLRKKRKKWSAEEDLELINAVNVYGEGNWTQIVKANFKGDRTANQLSQRWGIVKKRQRKMGPAEESAPSVKKEALLAAHQAMTHFLDDGPNRTPITVGTGRTNVNSNPAETNANIGVQISTAEGLNAKTSRMGSFGPTPKGRITSKKTLPKSNVDADRLIATAVAAGARIVSQSDSDAELLKAATQANNSIHVIPQTGGSMKSPAVRHIRTGLAATVPSTHPPTRPPGSLKTAVSRPSQQALKTDTSRTITGVNSCPDADVLPEQVQTGEHLSGRGQIQEGKVELPKQNAASEILLTNGQNPAGSLDAKKHGSNDKTLIGNDQSTGNGEDQITTQEQRTDVSDKDLKQGGGSH